MRGRVGAVHQHDQGLAEPGGIAELISAHRQPLFANGIYQLVVVRERASPERCAQKANGSPE
jgi:hypothetical protein